MELRLKVARLGPDWFRLLLNCRACTTMEAIKTGKYCPYNMETLATAGSIVVAEAQKEVRFSRTVSILLFFNA